MKIKNLNVNNQVLNKKKHFSLSKEKSCLILSHISLFVTGIGVYVVSKNQHNSLYDILMISCLTIYSTALVINDGIMLYSKRALEKKEKVKNIKS